MKLSTSGMGQQAHEGIYALSLIFPFFLSLSASIVTFWGRLFLSRSLVYCFVFCFKIPFNLLKGLIVTFCFSIFVPSVLDVFMASC